MPWCPKCKYEYVEGIKICPDCKSALVDEVPDFTEEIEQYEEEYGCPDEACKDEGFEAFIRQIKSGVYELPEELQDATEDELYDAYKALTMRLRGKGQKEKYKPVEDKYEENKSAYWVLIVSGVCGVALVTLLLLGVIKLPLSGFSLYLTASVMGLLFLVFLLTGIRSYMITKKLKPEVEEEKKLISEVIDYLKNWYKDGNIRLNSDEILDEEFSLFASELAINEAEDHFDDLKPGFAFYVVDKFYSEIFEDED